jgi:hypothetical protein
MCTLAPPAVSASPSFKCSDSTESSAIVTVFSIAEPQSFDQQKWAASSPTVILCARLESCGTMSAQGTASV